MRRLAIALILLTLPALAAADIVYSNFTAIQGGGAFVGGPDVPSPPFAPTQPGMPFPVNPPAGLSGFELTAVEAAIEWMGYGPHLVRVRVFDANGDEPGVELDWDEIPGTTLEPILGFATMDGGVFLQGGQTYWVVLYGVEDSEFAWCPGDSKTYSGTGLYHDPVAGGPWIKPIGDLDQAFRVLGTPTNIVAVDTAAWGRIKAMYR